MSPKRLLHCLLIAILVTQGHSLPARAFVGELDLQNLHSATIQLRGDNGWCTAVVLRPTVVLTAAHCVWARGGYLKNIKLLYRDASNIEKSVSVRKATVPKAYKDIDQFVRLGDAGNTTFHEILSRDQYAVVYARAVAEDIAVVVPSEPIVVPEKLRTLIDLDLPFASMIRGKPWTKALGGDVEAMFNGTFRKGGSKLELRAIGYGQNSCSDYGDRNTCKSDSQRRYGDVQDAGSWFKTGGEALSVVVVPTARGGNVPGGFSPIRSGDSGGPVFIKHLPDGSWRLAGIHSRSSVYQSNAAALFYQTDFIEAALRGALVYEHSQLKVLVLAAGHQNGQVRIGYAVHDTLPQAEDLALARCKGRTVTCQPVNMTISGGCAFITWGQNSKKIGWNTAGTAKKTFEDCQAKGYTCAKPVGDCL